MRMRTTWAAILVCVDLICASAANAGVIDFETDGAGNPLSPGTTISNQYASIGVNFIGSLYHDADDPNDPFASNTDMKLTRAGGDVPPLATFPANAGNFLHSYSGWLAEDVGGDANFGVLFNAPIFSFSIDLYDDKDGLTQIFALDANGDILDDAQSVDTLDAPPQTLSVSSAAGFKEVAVILGWSQDWVAADNIRFSTTIPEPTGLLLIPILGICSRRRLE